MTKGIISRHRQHLRVHGDLRLLLAGSEEERERVLQQIERRSQAAKAGWVKRRARANSGSA